MVWSCLLHCSAPCWMTSPNVRRQITRCCTQKAIHEHSQGMRFPRPPSATTFCLPRSISKLHNLLGRRRLDDVPDGGSGRLHAGARTNDPRRVLCIGPVFLECLVDRIGGGRPPRPAKHLFDLRCRSCERFSRSPWDE